LQKEVDENERISFIQALKAPYVVLYGFCYGFIKFASYSVLLWMPLYLEETYSMSA